MNKPICIFQAPLATRSGYGDMCKDIARHLIELDIFDLKIISLPWGATPMNALSADDPMDLQIISKIVQPPMPLDRQPEVFIHGTIPNEFQAPAKVNIGITAGIETNMCSEEWIRGCNRMTTVWGISNHAVRSIKDTFVTKTNPQGQQIEQLNATVPFEVLHNYVDTNVFKKTKPEDLEPSVIELMESVPEKFCFLFVGHWIKGGYGEDRKNIGVLIKTFCETFKAVSPQNRPALILKTSGADFSILDREDILQKIKDVKSMVSEHHCPNVYLIHGDLSRSEMNSLYNHPKVKVHVSFTKGEGFGRPLLEASMSEKPIIASGWSGHTDFLNVEDSILLAGELRQIEPGAVWDNILIRESSWFNVDPAFAEKALRIVFKEYDRFLPGAKRLAKKNAQSFSSETVKAQLKTLLEKYIPKEVLVPPKLVPLTLPKLQTSIPSLKLATQPPTLPTLKKLGETPDSSTPKITLKKLEE